MGNSINRTTLNPQQDPKVFFQADLPKFVTQMKIGNGKFMKSWQMRVDGVAVAVKVYLRPNTIEDELILQQCALNLTDLWKKLSPARHPNLLPYQVWLKSVARQKGGSPVYLIRQYHSANLYDRLSTRPFLHEFEKLWIVYQLFKCVEICDGYKVVHGDIKAENIMVTNWNWVVLTDFGLFKPVSIPDDDPTDYQYFFDTMGRPRCSVAPERFVKRSLAKSISGIGDDYGYDSSPAESAKKAQKLSLTPAMDVFSLGCTIAEIFNDGDPLLDLPGMLKYVSASQPNSAPVFERLDQEDSPAKSNIQRINNRLVRQVVIDMTQRDPERRLSARQYRMLLQNGYNSKDGKAKDNSIFNDPNEKIRPVQSAFPPYFESCLYPLFLRLHFKGLTPDDRIAILCDAYNSYVTAITGNADKEGHLFFSGALAGVCTTPEDLNNNIKDNIDSTEETKEIKKKSLARARKRQSLTGDGDEYRELLSATVNSESPQAKIVPPEEKSKESIEELINKCRAFMAEVESNYNNTPNLSSRESNKLEHIDDLLDVSIKSAEGNDSSPFLNSWGSDSSNSRNICNGLVIIIQVIVSQIRSLKHPQSRVVALMLLVRLGLRCSDDVIIQRIVPIVIYCLDDANGYIRASAIRCLRAILKPIRSISSYESNIFPNYIFPSFAARAKDPEIIVRIAFAESIGVLAEVSKRFLDKAHLMVQNKVIAEAIAKANANANQVSSTASTESVSDYTELESSDDLLVDFSYDSKLKALHDQISRWIRDLVLDSNSLDYRRGSGLSSHESMIKRAILTDMMRLCVFFGQESTMDLLLTQLLTFLNDQDWELRYAFCSKIASVCSFLGRTVTSECILPCIENALVDVEEKVIARATRCLHTLVQTNLISDVVLVELVDNACPLLLHPFDTIREAAIELFASISQALGPIYTSVFILPKLWPNYLKHELVGVSLTKSVLKLSLIAPISRRGFRRALLQRQKVLTPSGPNATSASGLDSMQYSVISSSSVLNNFQPTTSSSTSNLQNIGSNPSFFQRESEVGFGIGATVLDSIAFAADFAAEVVNNPLGGLSSNILSGSNKASTSSKLKSRLENIASEIISTDDVNEEEAKKISLISAYIDRCAQEMTTKTKQWKSGANAGTSASGAGVIIGITQRSIKDRVSSIQLDSLLEVSLSSLPDHSIQSIQVPHQKYGVSYFPAFPEAKRKAFLESNVKSVSEIRAMYGLIAKQADAVRSVASGGTSDFFSSDEDGKGASKAKGQNNTAMSIEATALLAKIKALNIPPLPPELGSLVQQDERKYNCYLESLDLSVAADAQTRSSWRPKENLLASTLLEHTAAVNRIAVSPDQTFFVTASSDKTAKVWQVRGIDRVAFPRSSLTYLKHSAAITDATSIENSHSVATCSEDGSLHIWRVDIATSSTSGTEVNAASQPDDASGTTSQRSQGLSVGGYSTVKTLDPSEGAIVNVQHFNGDMCSVLVYASQKGIIHGWDIRMMNESFKYVLRPELGYPTSSALSPDRNWITVGTNKGYIALWDIRFNVMCKLWHHSASSPINRLACSKFMPSTSKNSSDGAYLIVASGVNETAIWGLPDAGDCLKCFRAVPKKQYTSSDSFVAPLPTLRSVQFSSHPLAPIVSVFEQQRISIGHSNKDHILAPSVRSIIGRISQSAESFLMTGGSDRQIRFWDFLSPSKCYTVSGIEPTQQKPIIEAPEAFGGRLFMSYDTDVPSSDAILQSQLPLREGRGPLQPSNNFKDAILDMKSIDIPIKLMLTGSRDGTVKLWR